KITMKKIEQPHWNVKGIVQTISWGKLFFSAPNIGTVTCKKSDAGNVWNPANGRPGLDETVLFDLYECSSSTCRTPVVTASGLPWQTALEESPLGSGVIRDRTKGMIVTIECAGIEEGKEGKEGEPIVETLVGETTPRYRNSSKAGPSYEEFDAGAGALHGEGGALKITGNDYTAGFDKSEPITESTAATSTGPVEGGKEFVLSLGDAASFGYSEKLYNELEKSGEPATGFETAYTNDYLNLRKAKVSGTSLLNVACPGETTDSMIGNGPLATALGVSGEASCPYHTIAGRPLHRPYPEGKSQLEAALETIVAAEALGTPVSEVTLSIGATDELRAISRCEKEIKEEFEQEGKSKY